jgi:aminobenzoyl-glutamate utilization protein A
VSQSADELNATLAKATDRVREHRRILHRVPELGWCEFVTTAYVREQLSRMQLDDITWGEALLPSVARLGIPAPCVTERARALAADRGVPRSELDAMAGTGTGVVAELRGKGGGPTIAVRVDMDALPIGESDGSEHFPRKEGFASEVPGQMHACGHDGHVAIGLGVAQALADLRDRLPGTVRLLFQPAEEGTRGGIAFVEAGWLKDVDVLFTFHLSGLSGLRTGAFSSGVAELLSTIKFDISLHGRAAHFASAPDKGRSALIAASAIALLSQSLPRRPGARALINVGRLEAGTARNVVPEHGELQMEVRAETDELTTDLFERVGRLSRGIGEGLEVTTATTVVGRTPAADSDPSLASVVASVGEAMGLHHIEGLTMEASDDASAMMRAVQERGGVATYAKVGTDLAGGNHTPEFDFDERALPTAVELIVRSVLQCMPER